MNAPLAGFGVADIHIIESLKGTPEDPRTGTRLRGLVDRLLAAAHPDLPIKVLPYEAPTQAAFLACLARIADHTKVTGRTPLVHLEMHGNEQGVELTSKDFLTWQELFGPLAAINITCRLNMLLLVQACHGEKIASLFHPDQRAPFWGLIGPRDEMLPSALFRANEVFYSTLFASRDGGRAFDAMNGAFSEKDFPSLPQPPFFSMRAEEFFRDTWRRYRRVHCEGLELERRIEKCRVAMGVKSFTPTQEALMREELRASMGLFEATRHKFFFVDKCPDHAERFKVSYEDCA